jgi:hypothetical protein
LYRWSALYGRVKADGAKRLKELDRDSATVEAIVPSNRLLPRWSIVRAMWFALGLLFVGAFAAWALSQHTARAVNPSIAHASDPTGVAASGPAVRSMAGSFVSIRPPCACSARAVIGAYSLRTGRPLRSVATVSDEVQVLSLQSDQTGDLWITTTGAPNRPSPAAGGDPQANSCSGNLVRFDPRTRKSRTELTFPATESVVAASPNPDGTKVALRLGGCSTSFLNQHIVVENLRTGHTVEIGAHATPCHSLFDLAWNANGTRLVFPYGPSVLPANSSFVPSNSCATPAWNRLVIVSAEHASNPDDWTLMKAPAHCSYLEAAFDSAGIVAAEGCTTGDPPGEPNNPQTGDAFLVQLTTNGHHILRLPLARGFDGGDIATDPATGQILISEDQAAETGTRVYDRVWSFNGHHLHTIARYRPDGDASVTALPW